MEDPESLIKHVVVDINDFLVVANTKSGAKHMFKNGGITMMAKVAVGDSKELLRDFFEVIGDIEGEAEYPEVLYFGVRLPPIIVDNALDALENQKILESIYDHIDQNVGWWSRSGYKAIAEMSFSTARQSDFRQYNEVNVRLVRRMQVCGYKVHALGNCSRKAINVMMKEHGDLCLDSLTTSADLQQMKCAKGDNPSIYREWFARNPDIDPSEVLFLEVQQGYCEAAERAYPECQTMLYRGQKEKEDFVDELSEKLNLDITLSELKQAKVEGW